LNAKSPAEKHGDFEAILDGIHYWSQRRAPTELVVVSSRGARRR
jgi:hypothetical protein